VYVFKSFIGNRYSSVKEPRIAPPVAPSRLTSLHSTSATGPSTAAPHRIPTSLCLLNLAYTTDLSLAHQYSQLGHHSRIYCEHPLSSLFAFLDAATSVFATSVNVPIAGHVTFAGTFARDFWKPSTVLVFLDIQIVAYAIQRVAEAKNQKRNNVYGKSLPHSSSRSIAQHCTAIGHLWYLTMYSSSRGIWTGRRHHAVQPEHNTRPQHRKISTPILDKLSPEVRAIIYGHVFGPTEVITPTGWIKQKLSAQHTSRYSDSLKVGDGDLALLDRGIHTNILATNQQIYKEAIEVLYATRAVRGSIARMQELIQSRNDGFWNNVRWVEISKCNEERSYDQFLTTLYKLQLPSRIRSTFILSDCLTEVNDHTDDDDVGHTVAEFAEIAMLGPIVCINVGVYMLKDQLPKVRIVNRQLVDMWPTVRSTPAGYDGLIDAVASVDSLGASVFGFNVPVWASQSSLRCWVDTQQQFLRMRASGKWLDLNKRAADGTLDDGTDDGRIHHFLSKLHRATRLPISAVRLPSSAEHTLKDLNPNSPQDLLNEATEFLSSNIAGYKQVACHLTEHETLIIYPVKWYAQKDNRTTLSVMFGKQSVALLGGPGGPGGPVPCSLDFVLDPSLDCSPSQNNLVDRYTAMGWLHNEQHNFRHIGLSSNLDDPVTFTNLTHLFMALQPYEIVHPEAPADYQANREHESGAFLTSYILATDAAVGVTTLVLTASVGDLRLVVWMVIELLARTDWESRAFVQSFRRDTQPPRGFPAYVDPYIGWTHGRLLVVAAQRLLTETHQVAATLAAQWVRDSTLWEER